jgi:hypothetical protein
LDGIDQNCDGMKQCFRDQGGDGYGGRRKKHPDFTLKKGVPVKILMHGKRSNCNFYDGFFVKTRNQVA